MYSLYYTVLIGASYKTSGKRQSGNLLLYNFTEKSNKQFKFEVKIGYDKNVLIVAFCAMRI